MKPEEFHPQSFSRGQKHTCTLDVASANGMVALPVLLAAGSQPGRTLVVTAGIHGDEYEGVRAIHEVFESLEPEELRGTFLAVPVANPPAFWSFSRCGPDDGENMARVFPGKAGGSVTSALAFALDQFIFPNADFFLDLHSAGVRYLMPTMAGYHLSDSRSRQAADIFGAPVTWGHSEIAPGRTLSACLARGIPFLYTEARGAGRIHRDDLHVFTRGIRNLLSHLDISPAPLERADPPLRLSGDGNIDAGLAAPCDGFFTASVDLLETVRKGQPIGRILDLHGRERARVVSPGDGVIGMLRATPVVRAQDPLALIADIARSG